MQKVGVIAKVRWDSPHTRNNSYTQNIEYITRGLDEHEKQEALEWNDILDKIKNDSSNEQGFSPCTGCPSSSRLILNVKK